jgi:hypothetical protein
MKPVMYEPIQSSVQLPTAYAPRPFKLPPMPPTIQPQMQHPMQPPMQYPMQPPLQNYANMQ